MGSWEGLLLGVAMCNIWRQLGVSDLPWYTPPAPAPHMLHARCSQNWALHRLGSTRSLMQAWACTTATMLHAAYGNSTHGAGSSQALLGQYSQAVQAVLRPQIDW